MAVRSPTYPFLSRVLVVVLFLSILLGGASVCRHTATETGPRKSKEADRILSAFHAESDTAARADLMAALAEKEPTTAYGRFAGGFLHAVAGHDAAAESEFNAAIALDPAFAEAHNALGSALFNQDRYEEASAAYETAIKLDSSRSEYFLNLGIVHLAEGDHDAAVSQFEKALSVKPGLAEAYYNIGLAHYTAGRLGPAREAYTRAVEEDPDLHPARFNLAVVLDILDEEAEALKQYERFIEIASEEFPEQAAFAEHRIGILTHRVDLEP